MPSATCPVCDTALVPFTALPDTVRSTLAEDPDRQRQSLAHRLEKHSVCPECTFEQHGCGQPYASPEQPA